MGKRESKIAKGRTRKSKVFSGAKEKTSGGLTKAMLMKNKDGNIVSRKAHAHAKTHFAKWHEAMRKARKELNITGCVYLNSPGMGKTFYKRAKEIYSSQK